MIHRTVVENVVVARFINAVSGVIIKANALVLMRVRSELIAVAVAVVALIRFVEFSRPPTRRLRVRDCLDEDSPHSHRAAHRALC